MKLLSLSLLTLLFAIAVGSIAGSDSGHVMLTISSWSIHTSATFFVIVLFLSFLLFYFSIRSIVRFLRIPKDIKTWKSHRHQRRTEKYLTDGLINMTEGRWKQSEQNFAKAALYSREPYVSYLCAARAAQGANKIDKRDDYLRLASQHNPDANLTVGITQAELQLNQKQTEQALATLKHLQNEQPDQKQVKQLLLGTYMHLHDWQSVLELIPSIKKTGLYSPEQIQSKQLDAYAGLLNDVAKLKDKQKLEAMWGKIPRKLQQHPYLIEVYVRKRLNFDDTADCEVLLRKAIKRQWDEALVHLYGLIVTNDPAKQLAVAESYLKSHVHDAVLLLTLGRICKHNQLWGKAKNYLQQSIDAQANPEAYYEYARLHEHEGDRKAAAVCYEAGLALATNINQ